MSVRRGHDQRRSASGKFSAPTGAGWGADDQVPPDPRGAEKQGRRRAPHLPPSRPRPPAMEDKQRQVLRRRGWRGGGSRVRRTWQRSGPDDTRGALSMMLGPERVLCEGGEGPGGPSPGAVTLTDGPGNPHFPAGTHSTSCPAVTSVREHGLRGLQAPTGDANASTAVVVRWPGSTQHVEATEKEPPVLATAECISGRRDASETMGLAIQGHQGPSTLSFLNAFG